MIEGHGIGVVPLDVRLGDDGPDVMRNLTPEEFWERCAKSTELPETSAPSPGAFRDAFLAAKSDGHDGVVCVTISGAMSGTYQAACAGAKEVEGELDIQVVDSRFPSLGQGLLVMEAVRRAEAGEKPEAVAEAVKSTIPKVRLYGMIDTLENLRRGGRIGGAEHFVGSLLSFKPIIEVRDGIVEKESRQRTRARALQYIVDKVRTAGEIAHLGILHSMAPDIDEFVSMVAEVYPREKMMVGIIGPVIGTHAGPGAAGVSFQLA
jgi:DegV family protein with EDD domain